MASQRPLLSTFSYWHDIPILHTTCSAIQAGYIYKDAGKDDHTISSTSTSSSPSLVSSLPGPYIVTACMNGELIHWEKIEGEHMVGQHIDMEHIWRYSAVCSHFHVSLCLALLSSSCLITSFSSFPYLSYYLL